jgi:hypothetical protein
VPGETSTDAEGLPPRRRISSGDLIADVASLVALDHLDRRAAVVGEALDVVPRLQ